MRVLLSITALLLSSCLMAVAQPQEATTPPTHRKAVDVGAIPEVLDQNVNKLLQSWHGKYFTQVNKHCLDDTENVSFPEKIYQQRLAQLPCVIPMTYNPVVRECIDLYASRRRDLVRYMMGMADLYFPMFDQILDQYNLPLELKYLAIVESALNPKALSRAGAAGLWQFMLPTGRIYGLEINSLIDERLDPYKSTHAACKYFKEVYAIYGDWHLSLAAYNCGPGNVNKAIRRSGGKTDFWEIYPHLPRETRSYVPLFIAATYIMNYHCEHNLCPVKSSLSLATDTFMIDRMVHLKQVSDLLNLDMELISTLNPQYKREIIPGNVNRPFVLNLPISASNAFTDRRDSLYATVDRLMAANNTLFDNDNSEVNALRSAQKGSTETIRHTVRKRETIQTIANRYGVTAQNIRKWNGLKRNKVKAGRRLIIYIDNGGVAYASNNKKTATDNPDTKPAAAVPTTTDLADNTAVDTEVEDKTTSTKAPKEKNTNAKTKKSTGQKTISYKVRSGDSLYSISKKYPGMTVAKIQSANNMRSNKLKIGQVLKIPVG